MVARGRSWFFALIAIAGAGLAVRLVYVLAFKHDLVLVGDGWYYHHAANLLADGKGFVSPNFEQFGFAVPKGPAADHPPGYIVALALPSLVGLDTTLAHQIWSCLIGTGAVVAVGSAGRVIAGPRGRADRRRLGRVLAQLLAQRRACDVGDADAAHGRAHGPCRLSVLAGTDRHAAGVLGLAVAAFAFTRAEALLLVPLLVAPLAVIATKRDWRRAGVLALVATGTIGLVLLPWFAHNERRFERPVFVSTSLGWTMQAGNCADTYRDFNLGFWSYKCADGPPIVGDASVRDVEYRDQRVGLHARSPEPATLGDRRGEGRTFGFFRPDQQLHYDDFETTRDVPAGTVGLFLFYALVPASVIGAVILRERGVPILPLVSLVVMVAITVALTFGQTRYRASAEVSFVLLGAVAIDAGIARARREKTAAAEEPLAPVDELVTTA